ncbi:ABC-2 family transporter protein [Marinitoga lauensis]|uniref:ABC-2 family transporter protein n=1 Tax=Marinitoga lauensis TaxID=2201189 RepID=UPI0010113D8D|nr:ABC-2 family transporter protein [Marinitoga lauensis]
MGIYELLITIMFFSVIKSNFNINISNEKMLLLIGTAFIVETIYYTFFGSSLLNLSNLIIEGKLDNYILMPRNVGWILSIINMDSLYLITLIPNLYIILNVYNWHISDFIIYILNIIIMVLIRYSFQLIITSLNFIFVNVKLLEDTINTLFSYAYLPKNIYTSFWKYVFIVIPVSLFANVPVESLIKKVFMIKYFIFAILLFLLANIIFKKSLERYISVGDDNKKGMAEAIPFLLLLSF